MSFSKLICTIFLSLFIFFAQQAFGFTDKEYLSLVEKNLFQIQYSKEPVQLRLKRIEKEVYGKTSNLSIEQKITKLKQVFNYNEPVKTAIKTAKTKSTNIKKVNVKKTNNSKAIEASFSYPKVTELEKKVFQKSYEKENVYNRLDRLEIAVLKHKTNYPLADRVDNLESVISGDTNTAGSQSINQSDTDSANNSNEKLSELENQILHTNYPNDAADVRVSRLEISVFNKTSPEDEIQSRIERISSVMNAAEGSKEYNNAQVTRQNINTINVLGIGLLILQELLF